jgi:hypothetical protein
MATKWDNVPKLTDDVVKSAKEDVAKAKKGRDVDSSRLAGGAKEAVREAGARASNRNMGRAGAAGAALQGGYEAGRALDEATGVGKKLVDKSGLGRMAEKAANARDKVELSQNAKDRLEDEDVDSTIRGVMARQKAGEFNPENANSSAMKKGGSVRGWGIARGARKAKIR